MARAFANLISGTRLAKVLLLILSISLFGLGVAQAQTDECDQCGMTVDSTGKSRLVIVDSDGNSHIACCPICALKMLNYYPSLTISSFCDYRGSDYPIIITATNHGNSVTVDPESALIIAGGSCTKNRLVYNSEAADALLSPPNNGTSVWLSPLTNATVACNATRMSVNQAVIKYSGLTIDPTICEACGMTVTADSQWRYRVTDGEGTQHYVECSCVPLVKSINMRPTIETTATGYGPGYPIVVIQRGWSDSNVSPTHGSILRGGSCVTARNAYNQTAADNLLAYGYSSYTSPEQQYVLPTRTEVKTVADAIESWYAQPIDNTSETVLILSIVGIGISITVLSIYAFKKIKQ